MSHKRQSHSRQSTGRDFAITTLTRDYEARHTIAAHAHARDQLVFAARGVMTVRTRAGTWVVPPQRAVWIPARTPHSITMSGAVAMRTLYCKPGLSPARACSVVHVSPLLRELILHVCAVGRLRKSEPRQRALIAVLLHQLETVEMVPLQLAHPAESRLLRVANALLANPADSRTLEELCRGSGAGKRSIERLFLQETGVSFGSWRQQLRLMHALRLLAEGAKVTHAALESGYSTPSAFISMFRKALGRTPGQYFG